MISDLGAEGVQQTTYLELSMNQLFPLISQEQANGQRCEKNNCFLTHIEGAFFTRATDVFLKAVLRSYSAFSYRVLCSVRFLRFIEGMPL